ncbi:MAG TPA: RidA family protein [Acidimicrobiales bacterium]|nr:RidA family protein [Acidimicrobiales bacterium]
MPVELLNPAGLPQADVYRQVAIATGTRTVYLSGQVARDADGNPVGAGDLAAQVAQALTNVHTAITAVGGTFDDIAKLTIYLVDWKPEKMDAFVTGVLTAAGTLGFDPTKAVTLLGVAALGEPDLLVEIEAVAVLP